MRLGALTVIVAMLATISPAGRADRASFDQNPRPHSVVIDWVEAMLVAIEQNPPAPTATTWRMWVVASSMYEAWSAYDATALPTAGDPQHKSAARRHRAGGTDTAISHAAHRALVAVFPDQRPLFDDVLGDLGLQPNDTVDLRTPVGLGNRAAQDVIDARLVDGSNAAAGFAQVISAVYPVPYVPANSADPVEPDAHGGPDWDPNRWTPLRVPTGNRVDDDGIPIVDNHDPATYVDQTFLTPHWGAVRPFALTSGDQFRPPEPPRFGSSEPYTDALGTTSSGDTAFRRQAAEVLAASAGLTDEHKVIAEFWADGPHSWTPPGHWMQLAIGVSLRDRHTTADDVQMFMTLSGAVLDAGIVAWDAKRAFDYTRPASAITALYAGRQVHAWGGPNRGRRLIDGGDWRPYQPATFVTPPFAEYISGHSTFSHAAAEALTAFTGSDRMYDGITKLGRDHDGDGHEDLFGRHVALPGTLRFDDGPATPIVLRWDTFRQAADQAGLSRRYGGIHFRDGDLRGREIGRRVGVQAHERARLHIDPFGELRRTIVELRAGGQLSRPEAGRLIGIGAAAELAFGHHRTALGCRLVERLDAVTSRRRAGDGSARRAPALGRQIRLIDDALCARTARSSPTG